MAGLYPDTGARSGAPPPPRTSLVGRSAETDAVVDALTATRLVTLSGPGGVGKTRLAHAVAARAGKLAPDGVWWVQLAAVQDPALVGDSLAVAVGTDRTGFPAVVERLRSAQGLVVLDNCEHLISACAEAVDELLDSCPLLRVLATSREPLGVVGEAVRPVPPLAVAPATDGELGPAVQLFVDRARAAVPGFDLSPADAEVVARLCRKLGGLPLAIELAAARARVLSVEQILAGLDDVFRMLVGGPRTAPERQRTLRATLDWGQQLLPEAERALFRRIAVFPGGFDVAAAEAVAVGGAVARDDVLDLVSGLVDRSLVTVDRSRGAARYRLLPPIREYGRERLAEAGEHDAVGAAHLAHYLALAERLEPLLWGAQQVAALDQLEAEGNNLRAALRFARDTGRAQHGARLAVALWRLCALRGLYAEGREWMDWAATALDDEPTALRAGALRGGGGLAFLGCDYPAAVRRLGAALQIYRQLEDRAGAATALQLLGSVAREQCRYARAEALHAEALSLFTELGDRLRAAQSRWYLGLLAWMRQNWSEAVDQCTEALAVFRELGDAEGIVNSLICLGATAQYTGDLDRAEALLVEAHERAEHARLPAEIAWVLKERGRLALRRGAGTAAGLLCRSLEAYRRLGDLWGMTTVLAELAAAHLAGGSADRAAALLGAAARLRTEIGTDVAPCERADHDRVDREARAALGADGFAAAWARGHDRPLHEVLADDMPAVEPTAGDLPADDATADDPAAPAATARPVPTERRAAGRGASLSGSSLRLTLLGGATVRLGGRSLAMADWGYAKPRELFFLLATSAGRTKAQIGVALWPELSEERLRNAFHTALRDLRRALGDPGWIVFTDGRYGLDRSRELWSDLEEFEKSLAAARRATSATEALSFLQWAIGHYGGDLLPDLQSEWVQERRTALARAFQGALAGAGRLLGEAGRWSEAAEVHRRAVTADPLSEPACRALMASLVRAGEPAEAVRVYRELADRLQQELATAPAEQTRALYEQLTRDRPSPLRGAGPVRRGTR